jgi:hypothetical protein
MNKFTLYKPKSYKENEMKQIINKLDQLISLINTALRKVGRH